MSDVVSILPHRRPKIIGGGKRVRRMNYKKPVELSDLIVFGWIETEAKYLASVKGYELPEIFTANFYLRDKRQAWRIELLVDIENEIPRLMQVKTFGAGEIPLHFLEELQARRSGKSAPWNKYTQEELQDIPQYVQARHLAVVAKYHYELLQKAVALAIDSEAKKSFIHYSAKHIEQIEKELAKTVRRNVPTDTMLRDIAKRYKKAEKAGDPLYEEIMRHYSISERRARELITMCRRHKEKLLPKKKAGRPSVNLTPTRKSGK